MVDTHGRELMRSSSSPSVTAVPGALKEVITLRRTLKKRAPDIWGAALNPVGPTDRIARPRPETHKYSASRAQPLSPTV